MARKAIITINYGTQILIDAEVALRVAELVDGSSVVGFTYAGDTRIDYLEDEGFILDIDIAKPVCYATKEEAFAKKEAYNEEG